MRQAHGRGGAWIVSLAMLLALAGGAALLPMRNEAAAAKSGAIAQDEAFSEARLAALRAEGRPVFLYFTADWCLTCKANAAAAIDRAEVRDAFARQRSEEHTSELQSLMRISYAVFCLNKKNNTNKDNYTSST